ncbi:MAG: hypothetical protein IH597_01670 [Bacteroidales bacterium]|nr:hypothetical protein [Bacteroidales bacterium]
MKIFFFILLPLLLFSGCITRQKCLQRFPPEIKEITSVTVEVRETFRDTIIFRELPGDTIIQVDTVLIDNKGLINTNISLLETSLAWSKAQIRNNKLFHELVQKDTTLEFRLHNAIKEVERLEKELTLKTETVEVPRKLTKWQQFRLSLANISLVCLAIFSIYLLLKIKL